ncbi:ABC transporter ATP-binding protein [Reichenbachiella sp. MALMAid0571]|uniref:ABC transporter ATP-binding protein n=1 Tax=Reichenbachiella sp. MALMAid0571 TaxID=3143939 RepID=UPI0032DF1B35
MNITLEGIGKRFNNREWVIKNLNYSFEQNKTYAITGANGSGKSTLTKIISGINLPSSGSVHYESNGKPLDSDQFYKHLTYAAPYLDLIEELTLKELLHFHFQFKKIQEGYSLNDLMHKMYLEDSKNKYISNFSSGMKQRLKLGLALFSQASVTLLDEPTSNMDEQGVSWYSEQIASVAGSRILIIASNQAYEYGITDLIIDLN